MNRTLLSTEIKTLSNQLGIEPDTNGDTKKLQARVAQLKQLVAEQESESDGDNPSHGEQGICVVSDKTLETKRSDGSKLRVIKGEITTLGASDYALFKDVPGIERV